MVSEVTTLPKPLLYFTLELFRQLSVLGSSQCDQIGRNLLTKVAQKDRVLLGYFEKDLCKTVKASIWATFGNTWANFFL